MLGYFIRPGAVSFIWVISLVLALMVLIHSSLLLNRMYNSSPRYGRIVRDDTGLGQQIPLDHRNSDEIKPSEVKSARSQNDLALRSLHNEQVTVSIKVKTTQEKHRNKDVVPTNIQLVLFSTWIKKAGKEQVRKSILGTWRRWQPRITPLFFADDIKMRKEAESYNWPVRDVGETGCDNSTIPTFRGMFKDARIEYKNQATLVGFANGDLLFDDSLDLTIKSFLEQEAEIVKSRPVMILGKRLNVRVQDNLTVTDVSMVKTLAAKGRYPQEGSSDFFITNHLFPWDRVPEIVIGRLGFGMWIVAFARANNVTLYDVTKTVNCVHMTTHEGIFESSKSPNVWCNHKLINSQKLKPKSYKCGYIDCSGKKSVYSDDWSVKFVDVPADTMMDGCEICD